MHPIPCFRPPLTVGVRVQGRNYFKNLSTIKIYTYAKFHPDWSDGLDFYKVRIYIYIYIYIYCALYIRLLGIQSFLILRWNSAIWKLNCRDFVGRYSVTRDIVTMSMNLSVNH